MQPINNRCCYMGIRVLEQHVPCMGIASITSVNSPEIPIFVWTAHNILEIRSEAGNKDCPNMPTLLQKLTNLEWSVYLKLNG